MLFIHLHVEHEYFERWEYARAIEDFPSKNVWL